MKLTAYRITPLELPIVTADPTRPWMEFHDRFPYRCLPLTIANGSGWEILFNTDVRLQWDGGLTTTALRMLTTGPEASWCTSHFGNGILTMNLPYLFRTPPGVDLWVRGPVNSPRADIAPLEGIVETWWLPFTFTMNWQCLAKNQVIEFKKGDVACRIVPCPHGYLQQFDTDVVGLAENPELQRQYSVWNRSRTEHNRTIKGADWQKHYHRGDNYTTGESVPEHVTAVKLADFATEKERKAKESLGYQLSELLAQGKTDEEILLLLSDEGRRQRRGGGEVTSCRLIQAYRELWQADEQSRYLVRQPDGRVHSELFRNYEQAVAFANGMPDTQILRVQI